jgi:hypothetical protein
MPSCRHKPFLIVFAFAWVAAAPARSDDACVDFKWDVSKERALFAGAPAASTAGKDAKSAPTVLPNRLYSVRLTAQDGVKFPASPARKMPVDGAYAGLVTVKIPAPGSYRISVDLPLWIDLVSNGELVGASDFQGQHECAAPHKIVQFDLAGARPFVVQLSSAKSENVLLTVTPAPSRKL